MKKVITLILIYIFVFPVVPVYALSNPGMQIDKQPSALSTSQFRIISPIDPNNLTNGNGLYCPDIYISWNTPTYGQQGSSTNKVYVASFGKPANAQNLNIVSPLSTSTITSTQINCKYSFTSGSDTYEFSIYYDKESPTTDENSGSNTSSSTDGGFATYLAYNNPDAPRIIVRRENGSYIFILDKKNFWTDKTNEITVQNKNDYVSSFASSSSDNYPTWINEYASGNSSTYQLSNAKDENAKTNYILKEHILSIYNQGDSEINTTCESLFGSDFLKFLNNNVFTVVRIAIPLILILFTSFDFAKVIFVDDKDGMKKAWKNCYRRIIAALLIYLIPAILIFVIRIVGAGEVDKCVDYFNNIGEGEVSN